MKVCFVFAYVKEKKTVTKSVNTKAVLQKMKYSEITIFGSQSATCGMVYTYKHIGC